MGVPSKRTRPVRWPCSGRGCSSSSRTRSRRSTQRSDQIGSGDRSERIRTYNFPQNRLTDHRVGLSLYNLPQIMEGRIDDVIIALQKADYEEKLAALTGQTYLPPRPTGED